MQRNELETFYILTHSAVCSLEPDFKFHWEMQRCPQRLPSLGAADPCAVEPVDPSSQCTEGSRYGFDLQVKGFLFLAVTALWLSELYF